MSVDFGCSSHWPPRKALIVATTLVMAGCGSSGGGQSASDDAGPKAQRTTTTGAARATASDAPRIVFTRDGDPGGPGVFRIGIDGRGQERVTTGSDGWVKVSPDGDRIVYVRGDVQRGVVDLWVADAADGSNARQLTDDDGEEAYPSWTPDGSHLVFSVLRRGEGPNYLSSKIVSVSASGGDAINLTDGLEYFDTSPSVSPDGKTVVFARGAATDQGQVDGLYDMPIDGGQATLMVKQATGQVDWSPNGARITFTGIAGPGMTTDIFTARSDGSARTRITSNPAVDQMPAWSPGGRTIAFTSVRQEVDDKPALRVADLYVVSANGRNERRVTTNALNDVGPDWLP